MISDIRINEKIKHGLTCIYCSCLYDINWIRRMWEKENYAYNVNISKDQVFRFVLKTKIYENLLEYKKIICICFDMPLLCFLSAAWLTEMVNGNSFPYPVILLTIQVMTLSAHTSINTMHKAILITDCFSFCLIPDNRIWNELMFVGWSYNYSQYISESAIDIKH